MSESDRIDVHIVVDDALIDDLDVLAVIDPVWWTANIYDGPAKYTESLARFSVAQRLVNAVVWYHSEVNNGGHEQFFGNSTGIVWVDALEGFETFGPVGAGDILREAIERLGGSPSLDRGERNDQMDRLGVEFDDLDDRYYDLGDEIGDRAARFIQSNRDQFYFSGIVRKPKGL
ncbi:MAG: DUF4375 domain-containing protein [Pseudomonadota bacterium]